MESKSSPDLAELLATQLKLLQAINESQQRIEKLLAATLQQQVGPAEASAQVLAPEPQPVPRRASAADKIDMYTEPPPRVTSRASRNTAPRQSVPQDPEAVLLGRLVARVLSWPCKKCGKTGICDCYSQPEVSGSDQEPAAGTNPSETPRKATT